MDTLESLALPGQDLSRRHLLRQRARAHSMPHAIARVGLESKMIVSGEKKSYL